MLDNRRIKEAKANLAQYLAEGEISKESFKQIVSDTYFNNHKESLFLAGEIHERKLSSLWAVVISYYSMFYIANVVLYRLGYKIGRKNVHKVTADALISLVRGKLKYSLIDGYEEMRTEAMGIAEARADEILDSFDRERTKRSVFQYETSEPLKESRAKTSIERAREFAVEMNRLLMRL